MEDVAEIASLPYPWDKLSQKTVAISGGTGMIGSFLTDIIMYRNNRFDQNTKICILGRSEKKARERFLQYFDTEYFEFHTQNINKTIQSGISADYVIHAASNTHPVAYSSDPIGTITANVYGTGNLLEWASECGCSRFVFLSSVEIYGENRGDTDKFAEDYLGYIDCNTMRAGYPESKRTGEALCQAYGRQKGLDTVIVRLARTYGPTMLLSDTKAISQFLKKGVSGEDIVLKSEGTQLYSYAYVADAVSAILYLMFYGNDGEAYNVASRDSDITLKELAGLIADYSDTKVVFELPDEAEKAGYSKATKAILDTEKLNTAGWGSLYSIRDGIDRTLKVLRELQE
ncbi:MAG: NAD-dependent epimerase/dehydratase family protein [Lachnospiraceae bacterium]